MPFCKMTKIFHTLPVPGNKVFPIKNNENIYIYYVYIPWPTEPWKIVGFVSKTRFCWLAIPITRFCSRKPGFPGNRMKSVNWSITSRLYETKNRSVRHQMAQIKQLVKTWCSRFRGVPRLAAFIPNSQGFPKVSNHTGPTVCGGRFDSALVGIPNQQLLCSCASGCGLKINFLSAIWGQTVPTKRQNECQQSC